MNETWFIRHAQSESNAGAPAAQPDSIVLSPLGIEQSIGLAKKLLAECNLRGFPPDCVSVSRHVRTIRTAGPFLSALQSVRVITDCHHELTYLSLADCLGKTRGERRTLTDQYWQRLIPDLASGPDSESFDSFMKRVSLFKQGYETSSARWQIVFGHGQFFWALALLRCCPYFATDGSLANIDHRQSWMRLFRQYETNAPIENTAILKQILRPVERFYDEAQSNEYFGDSPEMLEAFKETFAGQAKQYIDSLERAVWTKDIAAIRDTLHRFRPSVVMLFVEDIIHELDSLQEYLRQSQADASLSCDAIWRIGTVLNLFRMLAATTK